MVEPGTKEEGLLGGKSVHSGKERAVERDPILKFQSGETCKDSHSKRTKRRLLSN